MRHKYLFGEFELNPASRELLRQGKAVALRPKSLECLVYLIENRARAVGRDELISAVWGRVDVADTVVAQTLLRARKALDDTGNQQGMIRTVPRFGYQWVAPVQEVALAYEGEAMPGEEPAADAWENVEAEAQHADAAPVESPASDEPPAAATAPPAQRTLPLLRRAWPLWIVLLLAAGLGIHFLSGRDAPRPALAGDAVLVMPVEVAPMNSEDAWVRLGAMDYMAARLRSSGINVLPSEQAMRLGAAIDGDAPATARQRMVALSGARWVAVPRMQRDHDGWQVRLRILDAGTERRIDAHGATALAAAAAAADAWLQQMGARGAADPPPGPLVERLQRIDAEILAGRLTEARRLVRSSPSEDRRDPRFILREAKLEFRAAHYDVASRYFEQVLAQAPASDTDTRVGALVGLGTVARALNDLDAAEQWLSQALALLESLPPDRVNARMLGVAYQGRGVVRSQRGDLEAGIRDMGQARVWLQRSGDLITLGVIGHNLGKTEVLRGDYLQALAEFDRAIETFERFRVDDYLTNTLLEKAEAQLMLARPAEAWKTIARADARLPKLEDDTLVRDALATRAKVQVALGRLQDADDTVSRLRARGMPADDPRLQELRLRLLLARGRTADARSLAQAGPPTAGASAGLMLAAVQSALGAGDVALARRWLAAAAPAEEPAEAHDIAVTLGQALVAHATGDQALALQRAEQAASRVRTRAAPELEIRVALVQADLLLDAKQYAAASSILGETEKYADADYRVAWAMSALYQALADPRASVAARERARQLAGERDLAIPPAL